MNALIALLIAALPVAAQAADSNCRVSETPERYEVICEGEPRTKQANLPAEKEELAVGRGKHRPQGGSMDNARGERMRTIKEQRQQETSPPVKPDMKNP